MPPLFPWTIDASFALLDVHRVHFECMLGEFPGNSWNVRRTPGEDFPVNMEEFNEHDILCGTLVVGNHSRLGGVRRVDLHWLGVDCRVE